MITLSFERTSTVPAPAVLAVLREGVVGGLTATPPPGKLVGTVSDTSLRARLPLRRFAPVLEVTVAVAGRGCLLRGRIRRNALVVPLLLVLLLLELGLLLVCVVAVRAGDTTLVFALPVVFLAGMLPVARILTRVGEIDRGALVSWLDGRLTSAAAATGAAP